MRDNLLWLVIAFVMVVPSVLLAVSLYFMGRVRRREALFRWASSQGFKMLSFRQPWLSDASPFLFYGSKAQCVFKIDVQDTSGREKSGWVLLGKMWRGLASESAQVRWDD
jgi:hypothetical protein